MSKLYNCDQFSRVISNRINFIFYTNIEMNEKKNEII